MDGIEAGRTLRLVGQVVDFDGERGFGSVRSDEGGEARFFHCTAIADGTRTIDVGARVSYEVVAGHQGRWEAKDLQRLA